MDHLWLHRQFAAHPGKTRSALAAALGLGAPAVSKILAGTRQIKAAEYAVMRRFFGLPVDGERAAQGTRGTSGRGVTVNRLSRTLSESAITSDDAWTLPASLLAGRTAAPAEQLRIFAVQETAMAPDFQPGEQVLVDLSNRNPSPGGVFVVSDGFGHVLRQIEYVPHSQPPSVRLSARQGSYTAHTLPLDKAVLIGRVIAKLQWL